MRSKTPFFVLACLVAATSLPLAAAEELTNEDIVKLAEAEMSTAVIVAKIASSETAFDTSVEALIALSENGVEQEVLEAMLAVEESAAAESSAQVPHSPSVAQADSTDRDARTGAPIATSISLQSEAIPGSTFRDSLRSGGEGPLMVVVPAGSFWMGCQSSDGDCVDYERPVHEVSISRPFAVSVYEVTFEDYDRFTHPNKVDDVGWGRGIRPVINVSWDDGKEYVEWLSVQTGGGYRLLSESEWEYVARAGSASKYPWGDGIGVNRANCALSKCGDSWQATAPVGSFAANAFGVYDMHGNVAEWVEDCGKLNYSGTYYSGAPTDGSAWLSGDCARRVTRGGSWRNYPEFLRSASRAAWHLTDTRLASIGFRVARTLTP